MQQFIDGGGACRGFHNFDGETPKAIQARVNTVVIHHFPMEGLDGVEDRSCGLKFKVRFIDLHLDPCDFPLQDGEMLLGRTAGNAVPEWWELLGRG